MDQRIVDFVQARHIAVVGASPRKFGGAICTTLKKRGYTVYPVHPARNTFKGERCFSSLATVPPDVEAAVIAVSPAHALDVVADAHRAGITKLWFQQGANFAEPIKKAEAEGIQTISGKCILMYAEPVTGLHAIHRCIAKVFKKL
jgi:predicted CoA-binding protein